MEEGKKIVEADWLPNDQHTVSMDVSEKDNPRLKLNLPANKGFVELTDTPIPYLIVVVEASRTVLAKGMLSHAHDILLVNEPKLNPKSGLTVGVESAKEALSKILAGPVGSKEKFS